MPHAKLKKIKKERMTSSIPAQIQKVHFSPKALSYMKDLLQCIPPAHLKKDLLDVFLIFLEYEYKKLPINFKEVVRDYQLLFYFLDKIEGEMRKE